MDASWASGTGRAVDCGAGLAKCADTIRKADLPCGGAYLGLVPGCQRPVDGARTTGLGEGVITDQRLCQAGRGSTLLLAAQPGWRIARCGSRPDYRCRRYGGLR